LNIYKFRLLLALIGLAAVVVLLTIAYLLAAEGRTWEAVAVGPGCAFGVVRALFALLGKLGGP